MESRAHFSMLNFVYVVTLTKAVDMGHVWPKTGIDKGLYMVHMWVRNKVDMGYNTPYHSHTLHCYCSRLWKIWEIGTDPYVCHIFLCGNDMGGQVQHHMVIAAMENVWDYQLSP